MARIEFKKPMFERYFFNLENRKYHDIRILENIFKQISNAFFEIEKDKKLQREVMTSILGLPKFLDQITRDIEKQKNLVKTKKVIKSLDTEIALIDLFLTMIKKVKKEPYPPPEFMKFFSKFLKIFKKQIYFKEALDTGQRRA